MHDKEFNSVSKLPSARRYEYFIKRVADWKQVWGLRDDTGWATCADDAGHVVFPVWPHERFAAASATGAWRESKPEEIPLSHWLDVWTPGLIKDELHVAVFSTETSSGLTASPDRLKRDIEDELSMFLAEVEEED